MAAPDAPHATPDIELSASPAPLTIWLTDRTRYTTGTGRCRRQRYLTNHFGPTGYGIVRKAESLPLMTGRYLHEAFAPLLQHLCDTDQLPPPDLIRAAVASAWTAYEQQIAERGFRGLLQSERSDLVVREQQALILGLVWAFTRTLLPWIHQRYRVLEVEQESIVVLGCDCGLPWTNPQGHAEAGCSGIGLMLRQDMIAASRDGRGLAYFEIKSTGWAEDTWAPQWETRPQLALGSLGLRDRYGAEVTETFIVGLYKGYRRSSGEGAEKVIRQSSPFCYGFCKPGNPPFATDEWLPAYEWIDSSGVKKRASPQYKQRSVWDLSESDWRGLGDLRGRTPIEAWVDWLPESVVNKQVFLVGPLITQQAQVDALTLQVPAEESLWQHALWKLYDVQRAGHGWGSVPFQQALDRLVPASWDCRRYGVRHQCEFIPLCFKQAGWEDPLASGLYVPRRPHHAPELEQAIGRGLLPGEAQQADQEEGED